MSIWQIISQHISDTTGEGFDITEQQGVGGGCINETRKISDGRRVYFVKTNLVSHGDMFEAEAEGLHELAESRTVKVPEPVCYGDDGAHCYLVLEYLDMSGRADMTLFARQFAAMHRVSQDKFGWHRNNTIGSTPQVNTMSDDWLDFWRDRRLGYQLKLAAEKGYGGELQRLGDILMADLPHLFDDYQPVPSMMHGDLWGGNLSGMPDGTPVIYDPAFYYGDREADLAMTELFGSFGQSFYAAYNEAWPLDEGYVVRKTLYNLYHIINHLNMFGGGYH
ncbi:MAG: fructosamine kinase family protein, partial [Gammaproteobacteria bacterium]|nr:fructosamine kinase family protein [Gammaproteobacteria bacterium]